MKTEIAFWDTSALIPLCCTKAGLTSRSTTLFRLFNKPVIWWGTSVEVYSALARLHQESQISVRELNTSIKRWEQFEIIVREVNPTEHVKRLAKGIPVQYQLRSLDAFQLAAALAWCQERPRRRPFVCFDSKLAEAADQAGFTVHTL